MQDQRSRSRSWSLIFILVKDHQKDQRSRSNLVKMNQYCYYSVKMAIIWPKLLIFDLDLWSFISKKIKDQDQRSWSQGKINWYKIRSKIKDHQWWSRSHKRSRSSALTISSWDQDRDLVPTLPCCICMTFQKYLPQPW